MKKYIYYFLLLSCLTFAWSACTNENYEAGDGANSFLRADFGMAHTQRAKQISSFTTDDSDNLVLTQPIDASWADQADSLYRALFFYEKVDGNKAKPTSIRPVPVLNLRPAESVQQIKTDPVKFESSWISSNKSFLNLSIYLKTGKTDEIDAKQEVGMILDNVQASQNGRKHYYITLHHAQNGVPEYYSAHTYLSIPLKSLLQSGDSITLSVNTYDGIIVKRLEY